MGLNIKGWVEIHVAWENKWRGAIQIDYIIKGRYGADFFLFGNGHGRPDDYVVAADRGLPTDPSPETLEKLGGESYIGHSWATWKEINDSGWQNEGFSDDWWLLLEMVRLLAERYGEDGVRLVVAFI